MTSRLKYKAVIFDLDGVLVNMPEGHFEALNCVLEMFGTRIEKEEHAAHFNGLPTRKKVAELERIGRLPGGLVECINRIKQRHTKDLIPKYCLPDYSKIILLKHLKERALKLACCSNSINETLELMLRSAHLHSYFDLILGNDAVAQSKPHPEIYLTAFRLLSVKPNECLIIEDSPHGIAAARASGARVVAVRGTEDVHLSLFENILSGE